jgi:hypothetical protein
MREFGQMQRVMHLALVGLLHARQGQAGRLAPGIDFEHDGLQRALLDAAVLEPDRERAEPVDHGPLARKQEAGAPGGTWHERLFLFVEHKHHG